MRGVRYLVLSKLILMKKTMNKSISKSPRKSVKRKKITPEEKFKRDYRSELRGIFYKCGFVRIAKASDKPFTFKGRTGDFDDIFLCENLVLLMEYTTSKSSNISDHLLKKKVLFDHVVDNETEFIDYLEDTFENFKELKKSIYDNTNFRIVILYCSREDIACSLKKQVPSIKYLDYPLLKYFKSVTESVHLSARFELFNFLGFNYNEIGQECLAKHVDNQITIKGTVLPESHSNLKKGYKVVSFYIDPESLLSQAYVLRQGGWKDSGELYQRMIIKNKIQTIRKYLHEEKRVFINNILVTLPSETKLLDDKKNTIDPCKLTDTSDTWIQIPKAYNTIGIIDGQHRVFAYYEGHPYNDSIENLRKKQNLLVTGIIYPPNVAEMERSKFEAKLFLEINSNQTNAKSDLKQAINLILNPFAPESLGRSVIHRLNMRGAFEDLFEKHFYDKDKIKTTTIVTYGLKPLIKLSGEDSLFALWNNENKKKLLDGDIELREEYIEFCAQEIDNLFVSIKKLMVPENRWTTDKNIRNKVLTVVIINSFIVCLRKLIENKKTGGAAHYLNRLKNKLKDFDFSIYNSSQYNKLGLELYEKIFN